MLESLLHGDSSFVSLTYDDLYLPWNGDVGSHADERSLDPEAVTKFIKRLRRKFPSRKIRYFLCGEYGDESGRPHYHIALFGLGRFAAKDIEEAWPFGFTHVGDLTKDSAAYVAGYVTKKMTHAEDRCTEECKHEPLNGRYPEFARMSRKPGIGADAMSQVGDVLTSEHGPEVIIRNDFDVPVMLRHGRRYFPLGRYLRSKLRQKVGDEDTFKKEGLEKFRLQMSAMFRDALENKKSSKGSWGKIFAKQNEQKIKNLEARVKIFGQKKGKL